MRMPEISLLEWQKRYGTEKACAAALAKYRWPQGFICAKCGHNSSLIKRSLHRRKLLLGCLWFISL